MDKVFGIALAIIAVIVGFLLYPTANTMLQGFITEKMPELGFTGVLEPMVTALPAVLLGLFILVPVVILIALKK